jgi:hypothetical protein
MIDLNNVDPIKISILPEDAVWLENLLFQIWMLGIEPENLDNSIAVELSKEADRANEFMEILARQDIRFRYWP